MQFYHRKDGYKIPETISNYLRIYTPIKKDAVLRN